MFLFILLLSPPLVIREFCAAQNLNKLEHYFVFFLCSFRDLESPICSMFYLYVIIGSYNTEQ